MFKLKPSFSREKLLLAFEYGLTIAQVAQKHNVEIDAALVERAERMIEGEFKNQTAEHNAVNMVPNILTVFELDLSK